MDFFSGMTLFQQTLSRLVLFQSSFIKIDQIIIVTNESHRFLALEQLNALNLKVPVKIILEPEALNTAPALTLACLAAMELNSNTTMIVTPSDHFIENIKNFHQSLLLVLNSVEEGVVGTLGIKPVGPETGFGYIKFYGNTMSENY
jgi:mannose-1-phosphate guanylyltransferase